MNSNKSERLTAERQRVGIVRGFDNGWWIFGGGGRAEALTKGQN
jgi:hypothetical protein